MKKILFISLSICIFFVAANAQEKFDLPGDALVLETQPVNNERSLVLWMTDAKQIARNTMDNVYACPERTRGSYYHGKLQISLVDTKTQKIINSVDIDDDEQEDGIFDVPYLIQRHYYKVPSVSGPKKEGKPKILDLQDFNGDGKAFEFAMYDALACQGLNTALFGYDEKQDKVIHYPIELTTNGTTETVYWIDYLFSKKPVGNGTWKYEIDYRGRGGSMNKYDVQYDKQKEMFVGNLSITDGEND